MDTKMKQPTVLGWFHWLWIALTIVMILYCYIKRRNDSHKTVNHVIFWTAVAVAACEIYKQVHYTFGYRTGAVTTDYQWYIFPFQFCSLPLYLFLLLPFLPEGKIKETFYKFIALFGTMGGCLVMGYPRFYDRAALCVHTMLWHTVMIAVGVYVLFARGYGKSWGREVLPAAVPFLTFLSFATLLNALLTPYALGSPNPLDLYYISPYTRTNYFVIAEVQEVFGLWASLLTYAVLFVFMGATLVFFATALIRFAVKRLQVMRMNLKKSKKEGKI
jgi:hypothetical protein